MTQINSNPMQTIIGEFKNISPEITDCFVFEKSGEVLACSEVSDGGKSKNLISTLNALNGYSSIIAGIETLTIQGLDSQLRIMALNNRYLTTVSTRSADEKTVKSLTQVIIPTVMDLIQKSCEEPDAFLPEPKKFEAEPERKPEKPTPLQKNSPAQVTPKFSASVFPEPSIPTAPAIQFMVEKIGGLLVASDTVRVDSRVIAKWSDLYGDRQITEVKIETLEGKFTSCKFKSIKESSGKGIIQIPEKILQTLQTSKGKLVIVKPVITQLKEDAKS